MKGSGEKLEDMRIFIDVMYWRRRHETINVAQQGDNPDSIGYES